MIFTIFDSDPLTRLADNAGAAYQYYAKNDELKNPGNYQEEVRSIVDINNEDLGIERRPALYSDQILPFDITITAANEYGQMAEQRIYGVEILNSGAGLSVDDIVNEMQCTFVARTLSKWEPKEMSSDNSLESTNVWNRIAGYNQSLDAGNTSVTLERLEDVIV